MANITINMVKKTELEVITERIIKECQDMTVIYEVAANEATKAETLVNIILNLNSKYFTTNTANCQELTDSEFEIRKMEIIKEILNNKNINKLTINLINNYINNFLNVHNFREIYDFCNTNLRDNLNSLLLIYLNNNYNYNNKTLLNIFKYYNNIKNQENKKLFFYSFALKLYIILKNKNIITEEKKEELKENCFTYICINELVDKNNNNYINIKTETLKEFRIVTKRVRFEEKAEINKFFNFN